ncbi:terpene synthase family protein [Streptomyces sp. Ac-502]|uniref:terpene synthase family protein n=1 Tax=Streptomyces sp. Ac-502 TaxID=3342801 RepID=UPI003862BC97
MADLAAYGDPRSQDLLLSYNVCGWLFLHDDWMDVSLDRMREHAVTEELVSILHRRLTPTRPLTAAFADLWTQLRAGMSQAWCHRAAWLWQEYFQGNLAEAADRREGHVPTSEEHLRVRDQSVACTVMYAVAERTGGFEVPAGVWHATRLATLRHHATRHIILTNEILSHSKDDTGKQTNLVSLVMKEKNASLTHALHGIRKEADRHVRQLASLAELGPFCTRMRLPPETCHSVTRHVESMCTWVRGSYDWYGITARYSPAEDRQGHQPHIVPGLSAEQVRDE